MLFARIVVFSRGTTVVVALAEVASRTVVVVVEPFVEAAVSGSKAVLSRAETVVSGAEAFLSGPETALSGTETLLSRAEAFLAEILALFEVAAVFRVLFAVFVVSAEARAERALRSVAVLAEAAAVGKSSAALSLEPSAEAVESIPSLPAFVDFHRSAAQIRSVERFDGFFRLSLVVHRHERYSAESARELVHQHFYIRNCTDFGEFVSYFLFGNIERQIAYEDFHYISCFLFFR